MNCDENRRLIQAFLSSIFVSGLACNFDVSWCGWRNALQTDDFNWKHGSGGDGRQKGSGTNDDHGGGKLLLNVVYIILAVLLRSV